MGRKGICVILSLLCVWMLRHTAMAAESLIPGGQVIGIELEDGTVQIAAFDDALGTPARAAGLQEGDRILAIDGEAIRSTAQVRRAVERSDGTVEVTVKRNGKDKTVSLEPRITSEGPKLGLYLKQGITGVGTVTWYDPADGTFGALGHGVNTAEGTLLSMTGGTVYSADVVTVKKGNVGDPGQLMGALQSREPMGELTKNTCQGIFGKTQLPQQGEVLPVADAKQVKPGPATIRSTVAGSCAQEYSVEILKIYPTAKEGGRNMLLKITDPALLTTTGGIVQGMSGSPIIQDGKLVGAVTHVLVNDPTTGYGIFIENMLDAAA